MASGFLNSFRKEVDEMLIGFCNSSRTAVYAAFGAAMRNNLKNQHCITPDVLRSTAQDVKFHIQVTVRYVHRWALFSPKKLK